MKISLLMLILSTALNAQSIQDKQWFLNYFNEEAGVDVYRAWNSIQEVYQPTVAVIDAGVDCTHKDLMKNIKVNYKEIPNNNIDDDKNGYVDDYIGYNAVRGQGTGCLYEPHGTHVAGIIASVYPGVKILPIVALTNFHSDVVGAIAYAIDEGVDVINLSLGFQIPIGSEDEQVFELKSIIKEASDKGITVVIAVGNDSLDFSESRVYPAHFSTMFPNVISVASSDSEAMKSHFSNYNSNLVDIFAPGSNIYSTLPHNQYDYYNGTSMASPIVAGVAALTLSHLGENHRHNLKRRLMNTSRRMQTLSGYVISNGLVNAYGAVTGQTSLNFVWK